ncbi:PIN domain-containing protein [Nonlabens ponticola]|uniref:PIN domain-containing protein n=1 Tax=Nonlabens ponticola TaxID=2496866 RepID=A0A3S9MY55_9FLAO|nr:PIN domain-containing protein [Nonlabens ponticola]AZQ44185.1 PIN domain-containing protein [Nonlabens ponticola]
MILIDSNSLLVLILGLMNPALINKHSKTSIYEEEDFHNLVSAIKKIESIVVLPNIWTEVDNLLNKFTGSQKELYVKRIIETIKITSEKYLESKMVENNYSFYDLGLADTLILECAKDCEMLITSDSALSDYARALGVNVYDMKELKNERLKQ